MKYCPICKMEYESTAKKCSDCKVDLVENLEEEFYMKDLLKLKKADSEEVVKYLEYVKVQKIEVKEEDDDFVIISVNIDDHEKAVKYMNVFIRDRMDDTSEKEDYYFDEYDSVKSDAEDKSRDYKSTFVSFIAVGIILLIASVLSFTGLIKGFPLNNNIFFAILSLIVALICFYVAFNTKQKLNQLAANDINSSEKIQEIIGKFKERHDIGRYLADKNLEQEEIDEGAKYFKIFDIIKSDVKELYSEDIDEKIINASVEALYDEMTNEVNQ